MVNANPEKEALWQLIANIPDPEIPVITIGELGVLRDVEVLPEKICISITPTYSGCPAMRLFEEEIKTAIRQQTPLPVEIKTVYSPAWTTDWISEEARNKLREYGIAPPVGKADKSLLLENPKQIPCPKCGSENTELKSQFGSTSCKALYHCLQCKEPFEYFKCL